MSEQSMNEKIKKLLRLAENAGTEHEAERAREAAARLMTKWGIEAAMLGDIAEKQEAIVTKYTAPYPKLFIKARQVVTLNIVNGMGNLKLWRSDTMCAIMGFESDVDRALMFIPSILIQADHELARWWNTYPMRPVMSSGEALRARRNFLFSFGKVVQRRLEEMRREEIVVSDKAVHETTKSTALVLRDRAKLVDDHYNETMAGQMRKGRRLKGSSHGYADGAAAGERARLGGKSIGGGGPRAIG